MVAGGETRHDPAAAGISSATVVCSPHLVSWPRAIFLVASLATAASCARHIEVPATAFATLAPYTRGEATIVRDGRQPPFVLAPHMEPKALARGDGPCVGAEFGASSACTYQASGCP